MRSSLAIDELSAHRAHSTLPAAWLDLAYGRISADEAAAAMEGLEPPALVERSRALFVPPAAADEERRLEALLAAHFPASAPRRAIRVPRWLQTSVVTLAAASMVLLLVREVQRPAPFEAGYALEMSSGYLDERAQPAAAAAVVRYREGQRIQLVVRPVSAVTEVGAVAFVVREGVGTPLRVAAAINEQGVVTLTGTPEALGLPRGRSTIVVVIGPPEHLPERYRAEDVQDGAEAPYDVVERVVEIEAAPDPAAP